MGMKYLIMVQICISPTTSNNEHPFMCWKDQESGKDGIWATKKEKNPDKIQETTLFQTLDIRQEEC